jgi:hypothetical protein
MLINLKTRVRQPLVKIRKNHAYDTIYHPVVTCEGAGKDTLSSLKEVKVHFKLQLMTKDGKQESFTYN